MNKYLLCLCLPGLFFLKPTVVNAKCVFRGDIDFLQKKFELELNFSEKEKAIVQLNFLSSDKFSLSVKLDHLRLANSYVSTDLASEGAIIRNTNGEWISLKGMIQTNYSLLNFKPFKEMSGYFELTKSSLNIYSLMWGDLRITGNINLGTPYRLNLSIDIIDMDSRELALLLGINLEDFSLSGLVSGQVKIDGAISAPNVKGELRLKSGNIETLKYNEILVNIEGIYPLIKFVDSNIFEKDGHIYSLVGKFNLAQVDNLASSSHDVKLMPLADDDFSWKAWTIRRRRFYGQDDSVEFEYQLKEDRPFKMRLREDEEIFSLEHSLKF